MATSVRIRVGLREFQLELDTRMHVGGGTVLAPSEAVRLLATVSDPSTRVLIRLLAGSFGARRYTWEKECRLRIANMLETGRLRLRAIEAASVRVLAKDEQPELEQEREENPISETHSVIIELVDAEGNPVPGEPFRIKLPDGTVRSLTLDEDGKAHVTGIDHAGTCEVCFHQRDASVWAPA